MVRYNMKAEQHNIDLHVTGCLLLGCIIDEDVQLRCWSKSVDKESTIVDYYFRIRELLIVVMIHWLNSAKI